MFSEITTERNFRNEQFMQIVWDWEDEISDVLGLPIVDQRNYLFGEKLSILDKILFSDPIYGISHKFTGRMLNRSLKFWVCTPFHHGISTNTQCTPIVIDLFKKGLHRVPKMFGRHELVYVSSLEALYDLRSKYNCENVEFLPVSIPSKSIINDVPSKNIDIIAFGRNHPDILEWASRYAFEKGIRYVKLYTDGTGRMVREENNEKTYLSNDRQEFLYYIRASKIALMSSPGIGDSGIARTGGYNPVTPRFLEGASSYCRMIGIYPKNPDFEFFKMEDVCARATNYEDFRDHADWMLSASFGASFKEEIDAWLDVNTTKNRAKEHIGKYL